ncbi:hypothetical protein NCCP2716_23500 [Sporosarcina sp. NCCP-2716]|uniref:phage head closure protein n=1 Tax=Sporosarcina sp. NCCP-2716 TaxID=2943679 RepID=UPI00203B0D36|nr:phage head closure protein [Sporosarcina sp. NCCP-2716]GKV69852.1 hypothetical protein NCCP2716_23500 [Sporosarcina sp. NCCP-2716]
MYDHELVLLSGGYTEDDLGNQVPSVIRRTVLCKKESVGRNEFYSAAAADLRPELTLIIHQYEYEDESKVEFEGQQYSVIRTYKTGIEEIELTCERVGADVKS